MRLIIAEKHSVGQAIAQAVGGHMEKHDGYVQVGDDLVTWAQLDFVNQAGGRNSVKVSILEKDKLMQLAQNIQRLVFADVEGQRHQESMDMAQKQYTAQTNSVLIQQQMLDRQRKTTADDNPSMPTE